MRDLPTTGQRAHAAIIGRGRWPPSPFLTPPRPAHHHVVGGRDGRDSAAAARHGAHDGLREGRKEGGASVSYEVFGGGAKYLKEYDWKWHSDAPLVIKVDAATQHGKLMQ